MGFYIIRLRRRQGLCPWGSIAIDEYWERFEKKGRVKE